MFEFGDVIYRPCINYAGKKNFVNTQIILEIIEKNGEQYIRSVDYIGQKWTDNINDLDKRIYTDKEKAKEKLKEMIKERNK